MDSEGPTLLIGVDGGGTGCRAAIADASGTVLAKAAGGPANVTTNCDEAIENVRQAIALAAAKAGMAEDRLAGASTHIGLAGVLTAADAARVAGAFRFAACVVTDDRATSVAGALGDRDGILISVGTGTIIAARRGGRVRYVGGWGLQVADQASGGWLGRALLERTLLCHDGIEAHSDLTRSTLARFDDDPNRIVSFAVAARPTDYAALAPAVVAAAAAADLNGRALMQRGADHINRVLSRLERRPGDILCLSGGIGPHYSDYLDPAFQVDISAPLGSALDGALRLAAQTRRAMT